MLNLKIRLKSIKSGFAIFTLVSAFSTLLHAKGIEYQVPVDDPSLQNLATFTINDFTVKTENKKKIVSYTLPQELTGVKEHSTFFEKVNSSHAMVLNADKAQMICWHVICRCDVRYHGLKTDMKEVENFINSKKFEPFKTADLITIGRDFSGDPGGTLSVCL